MGKSIAVILGLQDKMSPKLILVKKGVRDLTSEQVRAIGAANQLADACEAKFNRIISSAAKLGAAAAVSLGGLGISEAADLESYKQQLVTATKSTERATEVYKYAVDLANRTPFQAAELVSASALLEGAGYRAEEYLTILGDAAAATNRSIGDLQNGFVRSISSGDMTEFLQQIGVARKDVEEFAKANGIKEVKDALAPFLKERFGGGMEKQATTLKGLFSTIIGDGKNILATIMGINEEGEIVAGSVLDIIKTKTAEIVESFARWREDGTLDRIREGATNVFKAIMSIAGAVGKVVEWLSNPVLLGTIGGLLTAVKLISMIHKGITLITGLTGAVRAIASAFGVVNIKLATTKALSLAIAGTGIIGLVLALAGGIIGYAMENQSKAKSMDAFSDTSDSYAYDEDTLDYDPTVLSGNIDENANGTNYFGGGLTKINEHGKEAIVFRDDAAAGFITKIKNSGKNIVSGEKRAAESFLKKSYFLMNTESDLEVKDWDAADDYIQNYSEMNGDSSDAEVVYLPQGTRIIPATKTASMQRQGKLPENAVGTNYFGGGATKINEHGNEAVILPETHDRNVNTTSNIINIYVEGAKRSDDELAQIVAGRIVDALEERA